MREVKIMVYDVTSGPMIGSIILLVIMCLIILFLLFLLSAVVIVKMKNKK